MKTNAEILIEEAYKRGRKAGREEATRELASPEPAGPVGSLCCSALVRLLRDAEFEYKAAILEYEKAEAEGASSFWEHNAASYKKGIYDSYRNLLKSAANESESQQIDQIICELKKSEECAHAAFVYEKDANTRLEKEIKRLRDVLCAIASASGFDNIGNWARSEAKKALWPNTSDQTRPAEPL